MAIPKEASIKIQELLAKAQHDSLLTSYKSLCSVLQEHGLLYEVRVHSKYVGVHPLNRDGCGVNARGVHDLINNISHIGFDWGAVKALAVEVDNTSAASVLEFNRKLVASSQGALAPIEEPIRFVSLEGSHTNQALRCFHYQCSHSSEMLTESGKLSTHKLQLRDAAFADAVQNGLTWRVVSGSVISAFPAMAFVLQAAGNAAGQISQGESEMQLLRRVHSAWRFEHALSGSNVDFTKVRSRVLASSQTHAESIPYLYAFVLKFCGGHGAELLLETEAYVRHHSSPTKRLGAAFFHALSLDTKGHIADMNARVRHALLKLACLPDESINKSDISKLIQASDKTVHAKVKEADSIMTELRAHLQKHNVLEQCIDLMHQFDMDVIRYLMGRRLGRRYLTVGGLAHDFLLQVSTVTNVNVPSRFEGEASQTTDFPVEANPSSSSGIKSNQIYMCELNDKAQLSNTDELLKLRGIAVDSHVRRKGDGTTGVIKSMDADVATVALDNNVSVAVPLSDLMNGQWVTFKAKLVTQQMDVSACIGTETVEYRLHVLRANVVVAIDGIIQDSLNSNKSLKVLNKPRRVEVLKSFSKGSLVIAPCSTRLVSKKCNIDEVPTSALQLGELMPGVHFWLSQQTTIPTSEKTEGFVSPFWFIETSTEKEEVNLELCYVKSTAVPKLRIPVYKNTKGIKAGDVLKLWDSPAGESEPVVVESESKRRKKKDAN